MSTVESIARPRRNGERRRAPTASISKFFLQAEDGIQDVAVTGVQTCALPISLGVASSVAVRLSAPFRVKTGTSKDQQAGGIPPSTRARAAARNDRSRESGATAPRVFARYQAQYRTWLGDHVE